MADSTEGGEENKVIMLVIIAERITGEK